MVVAVFIDCCLYLELSISVMEKRSFETDFLNGKREIMLRKPLQIQYVLPSKKPHLKISKTNKPQSIEKESFCKGITISSNACKHIVIISCITTSEVKFQGKYNLFI